MKYMTEEQFQDFINKTMRLPSSEGIYEIWGHREELSLEQFSKITKIFWVQK